MNAADSRSHAPPNPLTGAGAGTGAGVVGAVVAGPVPDGAAGGAVGVGMTCVAMVSSVRVRAVAVR
ncbi:hypothetical protein GCM10009735_82870 [Actinomadura chokoriensis]